ncbi:LORF2 protein, partial [Crocuta crocuta]
FLKKLNMQLPYDPAFAVLGIYPRETKIYVHTKTCAQLFIAALFAIAKMWKQPRCHPISDRWNMAMRKSAIWPFVATWMELEGVMLSEVSQAEKDKYHMFACIGGL